MKILAGSALVFYSAAMRIDKVPVRLVKSGSSTSTAGEIEIQYWEKRERTLRALKFTGLCWAAAFISIALPIVHFVLVPAFLLLGPIVGLGVLNRESQILRGSGLCPHCQAPFVIAKAPNQLPLSDVCTSCRAEVLVEQT